MGEREGVIKFQLDFQEQQCLAPAMVSELDSWRHILFRLRLIGMESNRYGGLGFGNISIRHAEAAAGFIISGTQTGYKPFLTPADYCLVTSWDQAANRIEARGLTRPSSEALTHGQFYGHDPAIRAVVHGHCPEIWQQAARLALPQTPSSIPYGTPAMAEAVERLLILGELRKKKVLVMGGHEDGVVSIGPSLHEACTTLIVTLAAALEQ